MLHPRTALILALLLPVLACSSTGDDETPRMVAKEELPERYQDVIAAWKEDGEAWRAIREEALSDPALADFVVNNLIHVMVDSYSQSRLTAAGELPGPFERAQRDLAYLGWYSRKILVELLVVGDGVVSFLSGDTLVLMDDPELALPVAEKLMEPERESRRRAAELLGRLPNAIGDEPRVSLLLGRVLAEDPEWMVRAQAALAIGERGTRARDVEGPRRQLSGALTDPDPAVVESACKALAQLGDPRAIPALLSLLEDLEDGGTRLETEKQVQAALMRLSGQRQRKSAREWRAWYKAFLQRAPAPPPAPPAGTPLDRPLRLASPPGGC